MNRNKELLKWLGISIGVFFLSFVFLYIYNDIERNNNFSFDFEYLEDVPSSGKNAYLYLNGFDSSFTYVMDDDDVYSYYIYSNEEGNNILVKVNDEEARDCAKKDRWDDVSCYLEGGAYPLRDELKDEVIEKIGYEIELDDLYLDTELKLYRDNSTFWMLYICCICAGVIGTLVCLVLLIKDNFSSIKNNKSSIGKWIFRLSFLVYGVILMVSIIFGLESGFEEFLLMLLILGLIFIIIPIIPAALIYQIVYIFLHYKKKK